MCMYLCNVLYLVRMSSHRLEGHITATSEYVNVYMLLLNSVMYNIFTTMKRLLQNCTASVRVR